MKYLLLVTLTFETTLVFAQKPFLIPFKENGKWGIMDSNEHIMFKPIYDYIGHGTKTDWCLRKDKGQVRRDIGNAIYISDEADFSVIDSNGRQILDSVYQSAPHFVENHAVVRKGLKWIIVSKTGKEVILNTDYAYYLSEGLIRIMRSNKYGFVDTNGIEIIPTEYDSAAYAFQNGLVSLRQNGKWGLLDKQGRGIVYFKYDLIDAYDCIDSRIKVLDYERGWGFIDKNGVEVIPPQYGYVSPMSEGFAYFVQDDKMGFIDSLGKVIVPAKYDNGGYFKEGRATVGDYDHQGIIDTKGKVLLWTKKYEDIDYFSEGLAAVDDGEKYGYIDLSGKEVIPLRYDFANDFSEGLAKVELKDKIGFIDKKGNIVIPLKYDEAEDFFNGLAKVKLGSLEFYIDKSGKEYKR